MDIASVGSLSIAKSSAELQQNVSIALLKKAMDMSEVTNENMLNMIDSASQVAPGKLLDIRI